MDCVNHSGVNATAYCQNCGKPICSTCVRSGSAGQLFCEPCWMAWQGSQQPFAMPPSGSPSPGLAAFLGLIPGVGAMYNGQFVKGLVHVVIFAVLVSAAHVYGIFGLFIAGWVCYQVFDAYHTARARRDGEPLPDPLGLNDLGNLISSGGRTPPGPHAGPAAGAPNPAPSTSYQAPSQSQYQPPYQAPYQTPYQPPYQGPYTPPPDYTGQGVPPVPPPFWHRREPIGAIVLIALGGLFLMGQFDWFSGRMFELSWPILLIGIGVWLIVNRLREAPKVSQEKPEGGQK
jgi:TM2 domain-containing membrane protein YozV